MYVISIHFVKQIAKKISQIKTQSKYKLYFPADHADKRRKNAEI